jgi:hypothetical protein
MQYHCTSLAAMPDTRVHLVGYRGERCIEAVETSPAITQHLITPAFAKTSRKLFLLYAPLKVLYQVSPCCLAPVATSRFCRRALDPPH